MDLRRDRVLAVADREASIGLAQDPRTLEKARFLQKHRDRGRDQLLP